MELLEERIRRDGVVKAGGVLKVDAFLNHQMDIELFSQMAEEWKRLFAGKPINKILTIEASGIGIAAVVAHHFGVPVVFAKKTQSINLDGTMYSTRIQSFTHNRIYDVIVSTRFLGPDDHVLIIDDFLANGCALRGLLEICESAGATVEGIGIAIEKGFQPGGDELREAGYDLQSLAIVEATGSRYRRHRVPLMSRKRNVESEGGVVFIDPKMKALSSLDGEIGWLAAFPYGLQHVLAMFVANLAPIAIIAAAAGLPEDLWATLIQNAMFIAGIGTFVQLFPLWRVGSGLPIVMGISFTFVSVACTIAATQGYGALVGAVIVGGLIEGLLGLFARWWRRIITPIVAAVVVTSIGFSLLGVGAASFGGGSGAEDFGSATNLILGTVSLLACLVFQGLAKGATKQLSVLFGLVVGYLVAIPLGKVDFSGFASAQLFSLPGVLPVTPEFNLGAIITVTLIFLVSATETVGDCSALTAAALRRNPTDKELSGAVTADGLVSSLAGVFGCSPVTSFSQNVGLIAMTGVVNRRAIATGAVVLVLAGFVPVVSLVFASLPEAVLGGCTIMMFGNIIVSGFQMIANAGFSQRNITIAALSLAVGIGFTQMGDIFAIFPELVQSVFADNCVAVVFVVAILASLLLPKDQKVEGPLIVEEGNDSVDIATDALES